jgi:LuxR family maltose regulon positive regulatory protein
MQSHGSSIWRPVPWFLATAPDARTGMVQRPSIGRLLDDAVSRYRATAVAAPSGFGKTVAVSQWAARRQRDQPGSVSWLTLSDGLVDQADLLRGILTALRRGATQAGNQRLHRELTAAFEAGDSSAAMDAIAGIDEPSDMILVIDDFQKAAAIPQSGDLVTLIEHSPQWVHFVLITTGGHDKAVTRLRAHGLMTTVGAAELAFGRDDIIEAARLLDSPISPSVADEILATTKGWPGAVRVALMGGDSTSGRLELTDYIRSAVLDRLSPDLFDFVLAATVCIRLDLPVAIALSGRRDAGLLLEECISAGLFIERFGSGETAMYQWHSAFADSCRATLQTADLARWRALNAVASRELAQRYPLAAIEHALASGDTMLVTDIIASQWLDLVLQSRSAALDRLCIRVCDTFGESPTVLMVRACCRDLGGDRAAAGMLFARASALAVSLAESRSVAFIHDLSQLLIADEHAQMCAAVDRVEAALEYPDIAQPRITAGALFLAGWARSRLRYNHARAVQLLTRAISECDALQLTVLARRARQSLAFALANAGEFSAATTALASDEGPAPDPWLTHDGTGIEGFTEGFVLFWQGRLREAAEVFASVCTAPGIGYPDLARMMLALSVATLVDHTKFEAADAAVTAIPAADTHGVPWTFYTTAARAKLAEARGDHRSALELAAQFAGHHHLPMMSVIISALCRRLGSVELARQLALQGSVEGIPGYLRATALLTLAVLDWQDGDTEAAHHKLENTLQLAAPEQVVYPFADNHDQPVRELLAAHSSRTAHPEFLDSCRLACEHASPIKPAVGMLTAREREVLAYLRTPMTSEEIAAKLSVSVNTLKTHQRAIYRKLGVANRREAIRLG